MIVSTSHAEEDICNAIEHIKQSVEEWKLLVVEREGVTYGNNWDITHQQLVVNSLRKLFVDNSTIKAFFLHDGNIALLLPNTQNSQINKAKILINDIFINEKNIPHTAQIHDLQYDVEPQYTVFKQKKEQWLEWKKNNVQPARKSSKIKVDKEYASHLLTGRTQRKGVHVLLVEDDPFTLKLIEGVLQKYTIIKADNGFDAVESYMLNAPDIVFLDINLPGIDGHEVLKRIYEFDKNCYVVMLSGNTLMKDVSYSLNKGAKGFVVKPFSKEKLLSYVELCKSLKEERRLLNEAI